MELGQNLSKMVFKDYYDNLADSTKETVRNRILEESGMSYPTFYYKLRNNTFKPLELKLIKKVIEEIKQESHVN
ncbi:hypothetical protein [Bacteroides clarus]|jgi:hypothetical protein|uniref:hypothetical protein n=1 Tax=Bacteroides clarus TaxID=626929 RepID=UPI0018AB993F|nr:hypothetical protein [Bacteroides clarus]MCQ1546830.1 hypothetical protein [Bacteroides clarus]